MKLLLNQSCFLLVVLTFYYYSRIYHLLFHAKRKSKGKNYIIHKNVASLKCKELGWPEAKQAFALELSYSFSGDTAALKPHKHGTIIA